MLKSAPGEIVVTAGTLPAIPPIPPAEIAGPGRDRLERRRTLACVHPIDGSRGSVSTPQERPGHEARLAPEATPRTSSHPGLLSCLCALENPRPVVPTCRPWRRTPQNLR